MRKREATLSIGVHFKTRVAWFVAVACLFSWGAAGSAPLIVDGDFEACQNGKALRQDSKGQDWSETRKDTKKGRKLLMLSTKDIGGNATHKAMIKAHPDLNTYLTQRFSKSQRSDFSVEFDIYVRKILKDDNRSAFIMIGNDKDKKRGANSTGRERFVFMGFENSSLKEKMNLFAREGGAPWDERTLVAENLDLEKWYRIIIVAYPEDGDYEVSIEGETDGWIPLKAFQSKGKSPKRLTHLSFASWNDGAGTFYVDNVKAQEE